MSKFIISVTAGVISSHLKTLRADEVTRTLRIAKYCMYFQFGRQFQAGALAHTTATVNLPVLDTLQPESLPALYGKHF